jgi:membrane-associated protein
VPDLETLIKTVGYLGIFAIVFVETGLLVGFFLPGDSLLLTAGVLAASGALSLPLTMLVCALGSILGDQLGYLIGRRFGPRVFSRPESRFFDPENVVRARKFFDRFGSATVILARFVPVVRAFAPTVAGVSGMRYPVFLLFSVVGGVLWGTGITFLGYKAGQYIPDLDKYILVIVAVGVLAGAIPALRELYGPRRRAAKPKPDATTPKLD